jgi:hypothetical protein
MIFILCLRWCLSTFFAPSIIPWLCIPPSSQYVITNDNVENNLTMHEELMLLLRTRMFDNIDTNVRDSKRISCLAHVIQLTLKYLFDKIRINSKNENFRTSWDDKQDRATMKKEKKRVLYILTKVRMCSFLLFLRHLIV